MEKEPVPIPPPSRKPKGDLSWCVELYTGCESGVSCLRALLKPRTTFADVQTFQTFSLFLSLEDPPGFLQVKPSLSRTEECQRDGRVAVMMSPIFGDKTLPSRRPLLAIMTTRDDTPDQSRVKA